MRLRADTETVTGAVPTWPKASSPDAVRSGSISGAAELLDGSLWNVQTSWARVESRYEAEVATVVWDRVNLRGPAGSFSVMRSFRSPAVQVDSPSVRTVVSDTWAKLVWNTPDWSRGKSSYEVSAPSLNAVVLPRPGCTGAVPTVRVPVQPLGCALLPS